MSKNLPARRVSIRLTAREKQDGAAILVAVRQALSEKGLILQVQETSEVKPILIEGELIKDESLETRAREHSGAVLEREAAKAKRAAMEENLKAALAAEQIVAVRGGLRNHLGYLVVKGVRIAVDILENVAGAPGRLWKKMISIVLSGGAGKD